MTDAPAARGTPAGGDAHLVSVVVGGHAASPTGRPRRRRETWCGLLGLIGLVAAAYGQTLSFDLVLDDPLVVIDNPLLQGRVTWTEVLTSPQTIYLPHMLGADRVYRPLHALNIVADRAVWGTRAGGLHLSSALVHLLVVLLVWRLGWRLAGSPWAGFAGGGLLAVHPSAVEPVAFVSGRMDLLVGLGMAAILLLLRGSAAEGRTLRLTGALACFAGALGCKETAMVVPLMVTWTAWVHPRWFGVHDASPGRAARLARILPFWGMLALYLAVRAVTVGSLAAGRTRLLEMPAQALRALVAVATYAQMTLVPGPRSGFFIVGRVPPPAGRLDGRVLAGAVVVALLGAGLWWLRGRQPASALALGWYAAALVPTSNILPIYWDQAVYVAERSLYPALVGWCLFLGVSAHALTARLQGRLHRPRALAWGVCAAVGGILLAVTATKAAAWRDDVTLWTAALVSDPDSVVARYNVAAARARAGDLEGAQTAVRDAAARFPSDPHVAALSGWIAELRREPGEALRQYERAIALGAGDAVVFRQTAVLAVGLRDWERAAHWFTVAADRFPRAAWPHVGLGWSQAREGHADRARTRFDRAAHLEPRAAERPWFLGRLHAADGRVAEAAQSYREALALDPLFLPAHRDLAALAERAGRLEEAAEHWRRIADTTPENDRREALAHLRRLKAAAAGASPAGRP